MSASVERALRRDLLAAVLGDDRQHALAEIAVGVGEVAVDAADQGALLEVAVVAERHLAQQEVAHRVEPVGLHQLVGVDDVAQRLGHLLPFVGPPAVGEHALRRREAGRHQEGRPEHAMEADDVLADHVQVGRPVLPQRVAGVGIAALGDVVGERVEPDVHDVLGIAGHRHAPGEAGARHREVLQPALDEAQDLVAPAVRPDEARVLLVERQQPVGPGRELEEVRRLLDPLDLGAGRDGAALAVLADLGLALDEVGLVAHRVPAGILAEIDVARCDQLLPQRLAGACSVAARWCG